MQIGELVNLINELRESLKSYRDELAKNEALVRYCIVDPLLRTLGSVSYTHLTLPTNREV